MESDTLLLNKTDTEGIFNVVTASENIANVRNSSFKEPSLLFSNFNCQRVELYQKGFHRIKRFVS